MYTPGLAGQWGATSASSSEHVPCSITSGTAGGTSTLDSPGVDGPAAPAAAPAAATAAAQGISAPQRIWTTFVLLHRPVVTLSQNYQAGPLVQLAEPEQVLAPSQPMVLSMPSRRHCGHQSGAGLAGLLGTTAGLPSPAWHVQS